MNDELLFTPEEISKKLKITKNTVYEMIKRGDLDAHRLGKHLRISQSQFENYLLKSKGSANQYQGTVFEEQDEQFVKIDDVNIHVHTDLTGEVKLSIRPEDIILSLEPFTSSARNIFKGTVVDLIANEDGVKIVLDIGIPLMSLITKKSMESMNITKGCDLYAVFKTMSINVYK
ncbi:excisionase family DNA-binding protein [Acetobacterium sp.]|uniref:excisionase family DNA-binding protein n=1 Tax=Acetobacterium sp. TaxID=1872094 RepID=UPI000CC57C06|nr:excisionase family DNA-binding protein [Acetobacterium sp.]MDO9492545.1 helix-turn-helix domain-containing protein [Acetobacterium sp.]PKM75218.1 MAG: DNA-binding protein [Firmicutes bacterium HGW-Firmicutes-17]